MKVDFSILIDRTPEKIFPWLAVPENAKRWQGNIRNERIIESVPGMTGTKFLETVGDQGGSVEIQGEITEYAENKIIGFHLASKMHTLDVAYLLDPAENGTRVSIAADIRWKFPMSLAGILFGKRMREEIRRQMESECEELKRLCESGAIRSARLPPHTQETR